MEDITKEELKEFIEASTKSMAECLRTIILLNNKVIELEKQVQNLDRVVGNFALK